MKSGPSWWRPRPAPRRSAEHVEDVASTSLVTVARSTSASAALRVAEACHLRHLLVVEEAELLGVLCTCDLENCEPTVPVIRRMSTPPITISSSAPIDLAVAIMRANEIACLPVLRHGALSGVLTRRDLRAVGVDLGEPRCVRCGDDHHVRLAGELRAAVCLRCLRAD